MQFGTQETSNSTSTYQGTESHALHHGLQRQISLAEKVLKDVHPRVGEWTSQLQVDVNASNNGISCSTSQITKAFALAEKGLKDAYVRAG